jgi:hypothetical protein
MTLDRLFCSLGDNLSLAIMVTLIPVCVPVYCYHNDVEPAVASNHCRDMNIPAHHWHRFLQVERFALGHSFNNINQYNIGYF